MISVIIPTLNEERHVGNLLYQLSRSAQIAEIIVCDGGSMDKTEEHVRQYPRVKWVTSAKGRALQMNQGASLASCPYLLFLHADSSVDQIRFDCIVEALKTHAAGCFYLSFDFNHPLLSLYSTMSKINHPLFTFGDQGLFLSHENFILLRGFREIPIMEDIDMVRRLRKLGPFTKIDAPLVTSSRRFLAHGILRQQFRNVILVLLYHLGFNPSFLRRFYEY